MKGLLIENDSKGLSKKSSDPSLIVFKKEFDSKFCDIVSLGSTSFPTYLPLASLGLFFAFFQPSSDIKDIIF